MIGCLKLAQQFGVFSNILYTIKIIFNAEIFSSRNAINKTEYKNMGDVNTKKLVKIRILSSFYDFFLETLNKCINLYFKRKFLYSL